MSKTTLTDKIFQKWNEAKRSGKSYNCDGLLMEDIECNYHVDKDMYYYRDKVSGKTWEEPASKMHKYGYVIPDYGSTTPLPPTTLGGSTYRFPIPTYTQEQFLDELKKRETKFLEALEKVVTTYEEKLNELRAEIADQRGSAQDEVPF